MTRYIFITGGVASSLGKGISTAALGALLQARGYSVRLRKLDPYLNVDPLLRGVQQHIGREVFPVFEPFLLCGHESPPSTQKG